MTRSMALASHSDGATTAVTLERRAAANARRSGHRVKTAIAVGHDPTNAVHTSGNAHRANEISRRRARFPSMTSFPRRTTARRSANSAGRGGSNLSWTSLVP